MTGGGVKFKLMPFRAGQGTVEVMGLTRSTVPCHDTGTNVKEDVESAVNTAQFHKEQGKSEFSV